MTSIRLVALALLLSGPLVFAQEKQQNTPTSPDETALSSHSASTATASEPWKIIPDVTAKADAPPDPLARLENSRPPLYTDRQPTRKGLLTAADDMTLPVVPGSRLRILSPGQRADDNTCLTLRTYQVARDSKDSDSTHAVGYSTCQPASRYQLRTAAGSEQPAAKR